MTTDGLHIVEHVAHAAHVVCGKLGFWSSKTSSMSCEWLRHLDGDARLAVGA